MKSRIFVIHLKYLLPIVGIVIITTFIIIVFLNLIAVASNDIPIMPVKLI